MRLYSKIALPFLSLCLAMPLAYGQDDAAPPPPPPAQMQPGPNGQFMRHRVDMQRMDRRGDWGSRGGQWGHRMGMRHRRDFMLARMVRNPEFRQRIGITEQQAQKIQSQTFNFRKAQIQNFADVAVKRLELQNLLAATNPDRSAINQKLQEISDTRLAQAMAAINFHLDMRASLTPDQWQKLRQMRQEFFRRRFGNPGPNGPGPGHDPASGMHADGANG